MPLVSIIIPAYNAGLYLKRCINSIISQSFSDYEIIIIDDGSTDDSPQICDELAEKYTKVVCFHKSNGGVSSARNYGLSKAKGEWITFIDADDAFDKTLFQKCQSYFNDYDVIRFSTACLWNETGSKTTAFIIKDQKLEDYLFSVLTRDTAIGVCGGLYKRSLFYDYSICFDDSLSSGEDWLVLVKILLSARNIGIIEEPLYLYTKYNENSVTSKYSYVASVSMLTAQKLIDEELIKRGKLQYRSYLITGKTKILYYFAIQFINDSTVTGEQMLQYLKQSTLSIREILTSKVSVKIKSILLLYKSVFGLKFLKIIRGISLF